MQTRTQSAIETAVNYVVGYFLAWFLMHYMLRWLFNYEAPKDKSGAMVMAFTVVSVIRSYAIRRLFNWIHMRKKIIE